MVTIHHKFACYLLLKQANSWGATDNSIFVKDVRGMITNTEKQKKINNV